MSKRKAVPPHLAKPRPGVKPGTPEWGAWVREIEAALGYRICGHKNNRGIPCALEPEKGRTRCKFAGARSKRGPDHPGWKHGRHSQVAALLPELIAGQYEALVTDPKLLALESDIALTDIFQQELLRRMFGGVNPTEALQRVLATTEDITAAVAEGNMQRLAELVEHLRQQAQQGADTSELHEQWMAAGEHKRKLMESEGKRLERMQHFMTAEQVRAYNAMVISVIANALAKHVPEQYARLFLGEVLDQIALYSGLNQAAPAHELDPAQLPAHMQAE